MVRERVCRSIETLTLDFMMHYRRASAISNPATKQSKCRNTYLKLHDYEGESMPTAKSTMNSAEVTQAVGISMPTLNRWLDESREAIDRGEVPFFPLPIFTGGKKRRRLWNRNSIIEFLQNQSSGRPPSTPNIESATSRAKRHRRAIESLVAQGVKLTGLPELQDQTKGGAQ